jgi:hypothetical protein
MSYCIYFVKELDIKGLEQYIDKYIRIDDVKNNKVYIDIGEEIRHTYSGCEVVKKIIGITPQSFNNMKTDKVLELTNKCLDGFGNKLNFPEMSWKVFLEKIRDNCIKYPDVIVKVG